MSVKLSDVEVFESDPTGEVYYKKLSLTFDNYTKYSLLFDMNNPQTVDDIVLELRCMAKQLEINFGEQDVIH